MPIPAMIVSALLCAAATIAVVRQRARHRADARVAAARAEAAALKRGAKLEGGATSRAAETAARLQGLEIRAAAEIEVSTLQAALAERDAATARRRADLEDKHHDLDIEHDAVDERLEAVKSQRDRARGVFEDVEHRDAERLAQLEECSKQTAESTREQLCQRWLEDAQAAAAARIRAVDHGGDAGHDEDARRVLGLSVERYRNHFLTERNISKLLLPGNVLELLQASDGRVHQALEQVSNVKLQIDESGDFLRLEGLDGVGREVARRGMSRLGKKETARSAAEDDPIAWMTKIRDNLDRELMVLGKRAFKVLGVKRADPEIVKLVGALNYRTSYTQNQWLHAVEAAFLAGMMAEELELDRKLARRATLMHDIGKALTYKIEGSHAVIGADIARRVGEDEVVANAIGAHHMDETMNSPYAFLVAAADAMSGARPGARREFADGYTNRLSDLERIGRRFRGVDQACAVHGGRELRVYVRDGDVDELGAVSLSSEIAEAVSDEMTFPGQIKVTVIRAYEAVAVAL